jgi:hypothetical protein
VFPMDAYPGTNLSLGDRRVFEEHIEHLLVAEARRWTLGVAGPRGANRMRRPWRPLVRTSGQINLPISACRYGKRFTS